MDMILLLTALIAVESSGNLNAVGDAGKAVGCLQIHPIMVNECNRLLDKQLRISNRRKDAKGLPMDKAGYRFTLRDRKFESTSRNMAIVYLRWNTSIPRPKGALGMSQYEFCARIWNGGPHGWFKESTEDYWRKVKIELNRIRKESTK